MGSCIALWNLLKRSANKANELAFNTIGKCLKTPCAIRWNTIYDSLQDLLNIEDVKLNKVLSELKLPLLSESQKDFLVEYVACLKPIAVTLDKLQGDKNVALGDVIPYILNLEHNLKNLKNLNHCQDLVTYLIKSIKKRFDYCFNFMDEKSRLYTMATITHPRWKLKWVKPENYDSIFEMFFKEHLKVENTNSGKTDESKIIDKEDSFINFFAD